MQIMKVKKKKAAYICKLDECVFHTSNNSKSVVVVSDASIKNCYNLKILE